MWADCADDLNTVSTNQTEPTTLVADSPIASLGETNNHLLQLLNLLPPFLEIPQKVPNTDIKEGIIKDTMQNSVLHNEKQNDVKETVPRRGKLANQFRAKCSCLFCDNRPLKEPYVHKCGVEDCGEIFSSDISFQRHNQEKHPDHRPFHCTFPGCQHKSKERRHVRTHYIKIHLYKIQRAKKEDDLTAVLMSTFPYMVQHLNNFLLWRFPVVFNSQIPSQLMENLVLSTENEDVLNIIQQESKSREDLNERSQAIQERLKNVPEEHKIEMLLEKAFFSCTCLLCSGSHINENKDEHKCVCKEVFEDYDHFEKHLESHKHFFPFRCNWPFCGFLSKERKEIQNHFKLHGYVGPRSCSICGLIFINKTEMSNHMEQQHTVTLD